MEVSPKYFFHFLICDGTILVPTPNQRRRTVPSMVFINYSLARNGTRTPPLITNGDNHDYNEVNGDVVDVDDEDNDDMDESDPRPSI